MSQSHFIDRVFREGRSQNGWLPREVPQQLLEQVYELARMGPTSVNCSPARIVFVRSPEAKLQLREALAPGNVDKTMSAPVVAIVGYDTRFYERLPALFPHNPGVKSWFDAPGKEGFAEVTAFRNGTLQGAYLIAAARALGLDCGPMSGFDNAKVDAAFFAGTGVKSNFICGLGYGDQAKLFPRSPRLSFEEACSFA